MNSKKWKQFIQSRGRSFIFSTSTPVPIAAAAHGKSTKLNSDFRYCSFHFKQNFSVSRSQSYTTSFLFFYYLEKKSKNSNI